MLKSILVWLDVLAPAFILIAIIKYYRFQCFSAQIKWLFYFACLNFGINTIGDIYSEVLQRNNHLFFHIENFGNFFILSQFFKIHFKKKYFINAVLIGFTALNIFYTTLNCSYHRFDIFGYMGSALIFSVYSLLYYHKLIKSPVNVDLKTYAPFWFITAFFIYYATCNFIFLVYPYFSSKKETYHGGLWQFNNVMLLLMSVLLIKGILCQVYRQKSQ